MQVGAYQYGGLSGTIDLASCEAFANKTGSTLSAEWTPGGSVTLFTGCCLTNLCNDDGEVQKTHCKACMHIGRSRSTRAQQQL